MAPPNFRAIRTKIAANDYILDHPYGYVGVGYGMHKHKHHAHHRGMRGHHAKHHMSATGRARLSAAARSRPRNSRGKFV